MATVFISREKAIMDNPLFASYLKNWQATILDGDEHYYGVGQEILLNDGDIETTVLTVELAAQLNAETKLSHDYFRDKFSEDLIPLHHTGELVGQLSCSSMISYVRLISKGFAELSRQMEWENFVLMTEGKSSILWQNNKYPPVVRATKKLRQFGFSQEKCEAAQMSVSALCAILAPLTWIARCNASAPRMFIYPVGSSTVIEICKHMNFHFETFDETERDAIGIALITSQFHILEPENCTGQFY